MHILTHLISSFTAQKMKFSIKEFFSKYDQIFIFLRIWSHLLKKSLMENFIFCAVIVEETLNEKMIKYSVCSNIQSPHIFERNFIPILPNSRAT